jgi:hypothetical protein
MKPLMVLGLMLVMAWACDKVEPEKPVVVNGVERSELALAMREMYDQMKLLSDSIRQGEAVHANFMELMRSMETAKATTPSKIDESYHGMARLFLRTYEEFERNPEGQKETFNAMIEACMVCHREKCTGPLKTISKLKVD